MDEGGHKKSEPFNEEEEKMRVEKRCEWFKFIFAIAIIAIVVLFCFNVVWAKEKKSLAESLRAAVQQASSTHQTNTLAGSLQGAALTGSQTNTLAGSLQGAALTGSQTNTLAGSLQGAALTGSQTNTLAGSLQGAALTGSQTNTLAGSLQGAVQPLVGPLEAAALTGYQADTIADGLTATVGQSAFQESTTLGNGLSDSMRDIGGGNGLDSLDNSKWK